MATSEGVMDAASVLATFRSVAGDTFVRAIKAAQDMSAVFGQDLRSSAVQLGKALEDPLEGITALKRVGVSFTASQKDLIASLVATGDVAGAQTIILETLERQVGGAGGFDPLASRPVDPQAFKSAERFHAGGLIGANEVPIVALRGEEVLTRDDPRHRFNLGTSLQAAPTVVVQPTVFNTMPNSQARAETRRGPNGEVMIDVFVEQMETLMARKIGRGEGLAPTLERRYGLNPAAGAYR